jgi:RNA polymerase sigma-70 factor (ECF subfamily)
MALRRVMSTVRRVVQRVLGSGDSEYEDVVQTALMGWLEVAAIGEPRDEPRTRQLAAIIARNTAVELRRARVYRRFASLAMIDDAPWTVDPERIVRAREALTQLENALRCLTPTTAAIIYLHDVLGYETEWIANALTISAAAAQSRLVRGRRQLLARLQKPASVSMAGRARTLPRYAALVAIALDQRA